MGCPGEWDLYLIYVYKEEGLTACRLCFVEVEEKTSDLHLRSVKAWW